MNSNKIQSLFRVLQNYNTDLLQIKGDNGPLGITGPIGEIGQLGNTGAAGTVGRNSVTVQQVLQNGSIRIGNTEPAQLIITSSGDVNIPTACPSVYIVVSHTAVCNLTLPEAMPGSTIQIHVFSGTASLITIRPYRNTESINGKLDHLFSVPLEPPCLFSLWCVSQSEWCTSF